MTTEERLAWIKSASYEQLLVKWRFEPFNSPWFKGKVGDAFARTLKAKSAEISTVEHTAISKRLGWEK